MPTRQLKHKLKRMQNSNAGVYMLNNEYCSRFNSSDEELKKEESVLKKKEKGVLNEEYNWLAERYNKLADKYNILVGEHNEIASKCNEIAGKCNDITERHGVGLNKHNISDKERIANKHDEPTKLNNLSRKLSAKGKPGGVGKKLTN